MRKTLTKLVMVLVAAAAMSMAGGGTAQADCADGSTCFHCVCPCNGCAPGDHESGQGGS
jgi:hypothetical protein